MIKSLFHNKLEVITSAIIAFVICLLCYLMNNCPFPYWDSLNNYCWIEYFITNNTPEEKEFDDAFFINISYDKQLVDYEYDEGNLTGKKDITERAKLLRFLQIAQRTNTYKYIFLDIRFEKGTSTPEDSLLFATLASMRDVIYSKHSDIENLEISNTPKAAINDYFTSIVSTNFTRYQFLQNGTESLPLRMYLETHPDHSTIKQFGWFYFADGKLCQNSPFIRIEKDFNDIPRKIGEPPYYDLGPVLLDEELYDESDFIYDLKDKIVVVGDFVEDNHDTYRGTQPGPYLVYLAYKELENGEHYVSWLFILFTYVLYFVISLFILNNMSLATYFSFLKSRTLIFVANLFGYGAILTLCSIILYIAFKTIFNIFFPSLIFSILSLVVSYKRINYGTSN